MSFKVTVGEKVYYDNDWCSDIEWGFILNGSTYDLSAIVDNDNIAQYVCMIKAIENNTEALIDAGSNSGNTGTPYGALVKSVDGNFTIDFGDCGFVANIGKLLNDKAIFEDIVNKLQ